MKARSRVRFVGWARAFVDAVAMTVTLVGAAPSKSRADDSAVASSSNIEAERAYEAIRESSATNDDVHTEELARRFLVRFSRDPLAPRVELELGRLFVLRAMPSVVGEPLPAAARDESLTEAERWLARAARHADEPTAQRTRLYRGVADYLGGDYDTSIATLTALRGALVDAEDRRVHETALHAACESAGRVGCALEALDAMRSDCRDEVECSAIDERIAALSDASLTDDAAREWVLTTEPTRFAWRALASRVLRGGSQSGDWDLVRAIVARARAASVPLDAEGREIAGRLDRGLEPNPQVIGIIAGLTGPDAATAMACVRAVGHGAGAPPDDRFNPGAFRIIVRDHHGNPADAARAVSELFWIHRVIAIIGPSDAASTAAAAERASVLGVPLLALGEIAPSRFVIGGSGADDHGWLRREAAARFGSHLGYVSRRSVTSTVVSDEITHTAGRFDAATRARLAATTASFLLVEARPQELERVLASIRSALRRRAAHVTLVLSRDDYDHLAPTAPRRSLEGAVVLALDRPEGGPARVLAVAERARLAYARVAAIGATRRDVLADALASGASPEVRRVLAYRVVAGRLEPLSD